MSDSLRRLVAAHRRVTEAMVLRGASWPVTISFIDEQRARLVVGVAEETPPLVRALRAIAGGISMAIVRRGFAVRHVNKQGHHRPLIGGIVIRCRDVAGEGTIGVAARRQGKDGFVTCGHVVDKIDVDVYQPNSSSHNDWLVGKSVAVSAYTTSADSDSAFVETVSGVVAEEKIWKSNSEKYSVFGSDPVVKMGLEVSMQGASSATALRTGNICGVNASVTFSDNAVLIKQLLANYLSRSGDSGAPVFRFLGGSAVRMIGINVGATEPTYTNPSPDQSAYPPAKGTYAIISPWLYVEQDLGLD